MNSQSVPKLLNRTKDLHEDLDDFLATYSLLRNPPTNPPQVVDNFLSMTHRTTLVRHRNHTHRRHKFTVQNQQQCKSSGLRLEFSFDEGLELVPTTPTATTRVKNYSNDPQQILHSYNRARAAPRSKPSTTQKSHSIHYGFSSLDFDGNGERLNEARSVFFFLGIWISPTGIKSHAHRERD
ncbi:hypothetical protein Drorol1_Dr00000692, partial [Drosera rotundifolia]